MNVQQIWDAWPEAELFSGVFSVAGEKGVLFERSQGYRNRSEELPNKRDTAFGIASGTKLFTSLAIGKLLDAGKLSLHDRIWDRLPHDLGRIDRRVTVYHLLTHTSGIGDYLDEEAPDSREQEMALCRKYPVYLWETLEYYLPMITPLPPKFEPGTRYGYSNAGYVLLGLLVEAVTGKPYQTFVTGEMIQPLGMKHTGFYRMDALPGNTALGYMEDEHTGEVRTNIFSLPVLGGSDGGLYTCAEDLDRLWRKLFAGEVLSPEGMDTFLARQVALGKEDNYGLGVYHCDHGGDTAYYAVGGDFGVDFFTAYFPRHRITASALGNTEVNTAPLLEGLLEGIMDSDG
ncbi:MAG: beta-lactamase family protein [Clostridiales bacterium]|mgnify:CR=1 FL=1|nr:beta-lactamase family protein [Clostridiales bacterium]